MAYLEVLVVKRLALKVVYSRLPTGHGHTEDLDGAFGVVKRVLRNIPMNTWESFKTAINNQFKNVPRSVDVKDLFVVHAWSDLIVNCIDTKLSNLHKEEVTQHQWFFEALPLSSEFPFGVRTKYRQYTQDSIKCRR